MKKLDLRWNNIGADAVKVLTGILQHCDNLILLAVNVSALVVIFYSLPSLIQLLHSLLRKTLGLFMYRRYGDKDTSCPRFIKN